MSNEKLAHIFIPALTYFQEGEKDIKSAQIHKIYLLMINLLNIPLTIVVLQY